MKKVAAHSLVLKTAREMAHELFDEVMSGNNELYKGWKELCDNGNLTKEKAERLFVELISPKLLEPARAILAAMLANPAYAHLHESIYTSMLLDNAIRASRVAPTGRPLLTVDEDASVKVTRN